MATITRRAFNRIAATGAATVALGAVSRPRRSIAGSARIVVIGGGFAGATAARYLRRFDPTLNVVLVEPKQTYFTCPASNLVIASLQGMDTISHHYRALRDEHGVEVIHDRAAAIDPVARTVVLARGGKLDYERLIVAPGIDFLWDAVAGYDEAASRVMPHAWNAGPQTMLLRAQLEAMEDGGLVIISPPAGLSRCPPAPYERASLIAHYLKTHKPRSKILILDPKETYPLRPRFEAAWAELYPGMIEWVPLSEDGLVARVDPGGMTLESDFGELHKGDVINFIPPQKAGRIAHDAGLADASGWCPVDVRTFESTLQPNIHVIGDSSIGGFMPKSAFSSNGQGKVVAAVIAALIRGRNVTEPSFASACYSLAAPDYGLSVVAIFGLRGSELAMNPNAGGMSPADAPAAFRKREADFADSWYRNITADTFG